MPRRHIPRNSAPSRPDSRRGGGNATDAQRRPPRGRRGQLEAIAERRVRALELRKQGRSYREIGRELGVDVHTVHGDVAAELYALREAAVTDATELRALELERLDVMHAGLSPHIRKGSPPAVSAGVRVSERRAKLLGLDAPTTSKTEVTASSLVAMDPRHDEFKEALRSLDIEDLQELKRESDRMVDEVIARARARRFPLSAPAPALPPVPLETGGAVTPTEPTPGGDVAMESPAPDSDNQPTR